MTLNQSCRKEEKRGQDQHDGHDDFLAQSVCQPAAYHWGYRAPDHDEEEHRTGLSHGTASGCDQQGKEELDPLIGGITGKGNAPDGIDDTEQVNKTSKEALVSG